MGDSQRDGLKVEGMKYLGEAQRSGLKYMGEAQWNGLKYIGDGLWVTGVSLGLTVGIGLLCVAIIIIIIVNDFAFYCIQIKEQRKIEEYTVPRIHSHHEFFNDHQSS